jgi:hypothetical protein
MAKQKETKLNQDLAAAMPPGQFRMILKKKKFNLKLQASSRKPQAPEAPSNKHLTSLEYKII